MRRLVQSAPKHGTAAIHGGQVEAARADPSGPSPYPPQRVLLTPQCDFLTCIFQGVASAHGTPREVRRSTATSFEWFFKTIIPISLRRISRDLPGPKTEKKTLPQAARHWTQASTPLPGFITLFFRPAQASNLHGPFRSRVTESLPCSLSPLQPADTRLYITYVHSS